MCWPEFDTVSSFCNCLSPVVYRISGVFPDLRGEKRAAFMWYSNWKSHPNVQQVAWFPWMFNRKDASRKWEKSPEWQQEVHLWCTHFCCSCYNPHMLFTLTLYGVLWKPKNSSLAQRSHGSFMITFSRVFECCRNAGWLFVKKIFVLLEVQCNKTKQKWWLKMASKIHTLCFCHITATFVFILGSSVLGDLLVFTEMCSVLP